MAASVDDPPMPGSDARSDAALVAAINGGDPGAFETLYYRHRDWVVNIAFRFTGDRDLALDVLQETFLYFVRKFPGFNLTAQLKTFLYPAVRNLAIAARRKTVRLQSSEADLAAMDTALTTEPVLSRNEAIRGALAVLSDEHREVLWLRFVDGLSLAEIGAAMEIPLGTVKSRLHNALDHLRSDTRTRSWFQ